MAEIRNWRLIAISEGKLRANVIVRTTTFLEEMKELKMILDKIEWKHSEYDIVLVDDRVLNSVIVEPIINVLTTMYPDTSVKVFKSIELRDHMVSVRLAKAYNDTFRTSDDHENGYLMNNYAFIYRYETNEFEIVQNYNILDTHRLTRVKVESDNIDIYNTEFVISSYELYKVLHTYSCRCKMYNADVSIYYSTYKSNLDEFNKNHYVREDQDVLMNGVKLSERLSVYRNKNIESYFQNKPLTIPNTNKMLEYQKQIEKALDSINQTLKTMADAMSKNPKE